MNYTINANKKIYLDFAPKEGTLTVAGYTVVSGVAPEAGQVSITWATESYAANILTFHASAVAGSTVDVQYSPHLFMLQNLDPTRTATRTEVKKVASDGTIKLDGIPKLNSIVVSGMSVGTYTTPLINQISVVWADDYNYITATGVLTFHTNNIGNEYSIEYVPIGSRVDAIIINKFIEFYNDFIGETWKKSEMANGSTGGILHWNNITNKPSNADVSGAYLVPPDLYVLLANTTDDLPIGSITSGDTKVITPATWGATVTLSNSSTITSTVVDGKLQFNVVPNKFSELTTDTLAALDGTTPTQIPSATNKYVTNSDLRLSNARNPLPHAQAFSTIYSAITDPLVEANNLVYALNSKANLEHPHVVLDITDFPSDNIPTLLEKARLAGNDDFYVKNSDERLLPNFAHAPTSHPHSITDIANLNTIISNKADWVHKHAASEILGLNTENEAEYIAEAVRTGKLVNDFVISGLDTPTTGAQWARAGIFYRWDTYTQYDVGDLVIPSTPNGYIYEAQIAGESGDLEPTNWPTDGTPIVEGTVTWLPKIGVTLWEASPSEWREGTSYALDAHVRPSIQSTKLFIATTGGLSGSINPGEWPTDGTPIEDNTVVWEYSRDLNYVVGQCVVGEYPTGAFGAYYYVCTRSGLSSNTAPSNWTDLTITETNRPFFATKTPGNSYVNSKYTNLAETSNRGFCYVGATEAVQTIGSSTGGKRIYTSTNPLQAVARVYEVKVTQANASSTDLTGLKTQWRVQGGTWSADITYRNDNDPSVCDAGTINLNYAFDTAQYDLGDTWTLTVSLDCDWYDFIDSDANIIHTAVAHAAEAPITPTGTVPLCKIVTNGTGISSIVDLRPINTSLNFSDEIDLSYSASSPDTLTVNNVPVETRAHSMTNSFLFGG